VFQCSLIIPLFFENSGKQFLCFLIFSQSKAAKSPQIITVLYVTQPNILLVHFNFRQGHCEEVILYFVEEMLLSEGDQFVECFPCGRIVAQCSGSKSLIVDEIRGLIIVVQDTAWLLGTG